MTIILIFKEKKWNRTKHSGPVHPQFLPFWEEYITEKNKNVIKPVIYRLDGQIFECIISNTMDDDGDSYEKTFTEVRSTAKKSSRTRLPERIDDAASSYFEKTKPKMTIHVENRRNASKIGVDRDEKIENRLKPRMTMSTRRGHDSRNTTYSNPPTTPNVDTDDYDSADTYMVSQRESKESNNTYADDSNEYENEKEDDFSDDKSHEIDYPRDDKNDTKPVALLAAVRHNDANSSRESDEQDDYYKSKDGSPTVLVNNNIRFKFILSSDGRLLGGSSSLVMNNKTSPPVTLKIEKFTGDERRYAPDLDMNTTQYNRSTY